MITCMLIWFSFDRYKWCGVNSNHIQNKDKIPVGHPNNNSNLWKDTEVKQGPHVVLGRKYTMQALLRLIQIRLNGSLLSTYKDGYISQFTLCWKSKILHVRARRMDIKSVALLIYSKLPSGDCGIEV